jgi:threonine dehydratase
VGLTTHGKGESGASRQLHAARLRALDLTHDELAKEHIRHMVGGPRSWRRTSACCASSSRTPGALMKFLSHMRPNWNISLFHYRNQGADYGRILVGLQVPRGDDQAFQAFLDTLGYPYVEETDNPVYQLFLQARSSSAPSAG